MLSVRDGKPYISYVHNAFAETRHSVRVAWPKHTIDVNNAPKAGTYEDHTFTGYWEVMTVPAANVPATDEYISNGVPANNGGWAAPAALSDGNAAALRGFTTASGIQAFNASGVISNINKTVLVGYMTPSWYEGAVLKYSIIDSQGQ